jgi:hypothetical protein
MEEGEKFRSTGIGGPNVVLAQFATIMEEPTLEPFRTNEWRSYCDKFEKEKRL